MKKNKDIVNIEEWVEIARKDWKRLKRSLRAVDAEAAGFFLQQSLEKYLKAFILQHGWNLRKIHELDSLFLMLQNVILFLRIFGIYVHVCQDIILQTDIPLSAY